MNNDRTALGQARPTLPRLALVMGDPAGIGPEIVVKCLRSADLYQHCLPVVVGDLRAIQSAPGFDPAATKIQTVTSPQEAQPGPQVLSLLDLHNVPDSVRPGQMSAESGRASLELLRKAVELAVAGDVAGVVFAPLNKEAMIKGGLRHADEYGFMSELCGGADYSVMVVGPRFILASVSLHIPMKDVAANVTRERVLSTIRYSYQAALVNGVAEPRIAVVALNPHGGEHGTMGHEEETEIRPAIADAQREGMNVSGPFPPDTAFISAKDVPYDVYVGMYHDQGRIALKFMDFGRAITVGEGLPFFVCTPSHGTAYDIAGLGKARHENLRDTLLYAARRASVAAAVHSAASPV